MSSRMVSGVWSGVLDLDRFVRIHFVFFSCLWPLLGAVSVGRDSSFSEMTALVLVALCFHVFAFVLNDVIDLPIDRSQPLRRQDPLVRGAIRSWQALLVALVQPPLTIPLTVWLGGGVEALGVLGAGFVCMAAYNLWGKRSGAPPVTDFVQGVAWGSLPVYAAYALGAAPTRMTWLVAAYAVWYTLFMNGVHGGLRDLANDFQKGALTTAIFLGARPSPHGAPPRVPVAVTMFTSSTLAAIVALNAALLAWNDFGYSRATLMATTAAVATLLIGAAALMPRVVRPRGFVWEVTFRAQMYLALMALPVAFAASMSLAVLCILAALKVISLAVLEWTAVIAKWALASLLAAIEAGQRELQARGSPADK